MNRNNDHSKSSEPLTQEHHQQLILARKRAQSIHKAARVASFNGWMTAIFAVLSAPFALYDVTALLVTVGLAVIAYNEFRGRKRLLAFEPTSATFLGWNQIAFLTLIVAYCLWMLYSTLTTDSPLIAEIKSRPELEAAFGSGGNFDQLIRRMAVALYGSVIALSVIFQGLNAAYYFTRRKQIEAYAQETPAWILELQRRTGAV